MFWEAEAFNKDVSKWNTLKVTDMQGMFWGAKAFNQCLKPWISERNRSAALHLLTDLQVKEYLGIRSLNQLTCGTMVNAPLAQASSCITCTINSFLMLFLIALQQRP